VTKIAVTGSNGQLGTPLCAQLEARGYEVLRLDRARAELRNPASVVAAIVAGAPEIVMHCGAMTNVDGCETDRAGAFQVNAGGSRAVAIGAERVGARIIAVSTDYVFAGDDLAGYDELSPTGPRSVYGASKLAGESPVLAARPDNIVARVSWLFGPDGGNFVRSILARAGAGHPLRVVDDQRGIPTYAPDLAGFLIDLIELPCGGLLHLSSGVEELSWHGFAEAAVELAGLGTEIAPMSSAELDRPAPRPSCSTLRSLVLPSLGLKPMRSWREGLGEYIADHKPHQQG